MAVNDTMLHIRQHDTLSVYAAHKPSTEKMRLKAAVPLKTEVPTMGLHSNKNFVTANAIQAILAKPKHMPEDFRWGTAPCLKTENHVACHTVQIYESTASDGAK